MTYGQFFAVINPIIYAAMTGVAATSTVLLRKWIKSALLDKGMTFAAGWVYSKLTVAEGGIANTAVKNNLLVTAGSLFLSSYPTTAAHYGITPANVTTWVEGHLGKLLAVDPTVSVSPAATPVPANGVTSATAIPVAAMGDNPPTT